jgi:hypothetical protein
MLGSDTTASPEAVLDAASTIRSLQGVLLRTLVTLACQIDQRDAWSGRTIASSFVAPGWTGASSVIGAL